MKITRRFGKNVEFRRSLMKNLTTSLILHEQIKTTLAKAKELRRHADRMIVLAKKGTPAAMVMAKKMVTNQEVIEKLFRYYPSRFKYRHGGYTRLRRAGFRKGDCAEMAIIEYVRDDLSMVPSDYGVNLPQEEEL